METLPWPDYWQSRQTGQLGPLAQELCIAQKTVCCLPEPQTGSSQIDLPDTTLVRSVGLSAVLIDHGIDLPDPAAIDGFGQPGHSQA